MSFSNLPVETILMMIKVSLPTTEGSVAMSPEEIIIANVAKQSHSENKIFFYGIATLRSQ